MGTDGVNEAQKYKGKAAPASGSCQGEVSIPGKGWKGNILTRDRAGGAPTDEEGDVCSSLNELSAGRGGERVFLLEFKESKKIPGFAQAAALAYPKSQTMLSMGYRNVLLPYQQQLCHFPKLSGHLSQENHGIGKMRTPQPQRTGVAWS